MYIHTSASHPHHASARYWPAIGYMDRYLDILTLSEYLKSLSISQYISIAYIYIYINIHHLQTYHASDISVCATYTYTYFPWHPDQRQHSFLYNVPQPNPLRLSHFASIGLCLFSSLFLSMTYSKYSIFMGLWWIYLCNTMNFYNLFCNTMYLCVYIYVFSLYICLSLSLLCLCLCTFLCPCHRYRSPWWPWRGVNPQITLPLSLWQCLYTFLCPHHDCHRPSRPCWDLIYLSLSICLAMYRSFYSLFVSIYIDIIYTYMCVCV